MKLFQKWPKIWPTIFYGLFIALLAASIVPFLLGTLTREESVTLQAPLESENQLVEVFPDLEGAVSSQEEQDLLLSERLNDHRLNVQLNDQLNELFLRDWHIWPDEQDFILAVYQDPAERDRVVCFFEGITGSRKIAAVILKNAAEFNIPPSLAFSLCWEESRYDPRAINRDNSNKTIDRGLFQLNSASFPDLREQDFFDPEVNARHGLSYLRWCLNTAGTEIAGLAMYNAGSNRVRAGGTPKLTLDYVSRIINRQRKIDELFLEKYFRPVIAEAEVPEIKIPGFALSRLTPLGRF